MLLLHLHPALSAWPSALLFFCLVLEVLNVFYPRQLLDNMAQVAILAAGIGCLAAFLSGYYASEIANQSFVVADEAIARHHNLGRFLLILYFPTIACRIFASRAKYGRRWFGCFYVLGLVGLTALTIFAAYLGAELIFSHGAGVRIEATGQSGSH